jgi:hypothetical protein
MAPSLEQPEARSGAAGKAYALPTPSMPPSVLILRMMNSSDAGVGPEEKMSLPLCFWSIGTISTLVIFIINPP